VTPTVPPPHTVTATTLRRGADTTTPNTLLPCRRLAATQLRVRHHAHDRAFVPPLGPRRPQGCISTTDARAQRPFLFDSGQFDGLLPPSRPATSTLRPAASALCVWLWFCGAAEPALPSGSLRTRAEVRAMASGAQPFRTTPPSTPPRIRVATPPPPIPSSAAAEMRDSPRRADTAAHSGPTGGGAGPASAAVMPEADDTAALPRTSHTRARGDAPAYTPRPRYGPRAPTISKAELQRGRRSICTQCKRSQKVSSNIAMCPRDCPCPWAVRPPAQPGWGWEWILQGDCAFWSRTAERRAHRRMCYVCRCAVTVGDEHPTCPPQCPCPWASPRLIKLPPDENGVEVTVTWEEHQRVLDQRREAEREEALKRPPQWERRLALPDAEGKREEYWVNRNLPAAPVWWAPKALGRLPLPRRF